MAGVRNKCPAGLSPRRNQTPDRKRARPRLAAQRGQGSGTVFPAIGESVIDNAIQALKRERKTEQTGRACQPIIPAAISPSHTGSRPCLNHGEMPNGERFSARQGKNSQEYFVYFKNYSRSMAEKDLLLGRFDIFQTRPKYPASPEKRPSMGWRSYPGTPLIPYLRSQR